MRKAEKLRWMRETDLIDQLAAKPGNSPIRKLIVEVTEDDCRKGNPGHPMSCAISVALRRAFPEATYACTRHDNLTVTIARRYLHFHMSRKASGFIDRFDQGAAEPTVLELHLVDVKKVKQQSEERKVQINVARDRRAQEGRPDKTYYSDPLRMRTTKSAKEKAKAELRLAIDRAKRAA
jgi:hypothetical protein